MYVVYLSLIAFILPSSMSRLYCRHENNTTWICNYFPKEIPVGISRVIIKDFNKDGVDIVINSSFFETKQWMYVKYLELSDDTGYGTLTLNASCFSHLQMLSEIHVHLNLAQFNLSSDVFVGSNTVKVLNMSECVRLCMCNFVPTINGANKLPHLEVLDISRLGAFCRPLVIDSNFGHILHSKRIREMAIKSTAITYFDLAIFGYLKALEKLNISYSQIGNVYGGHRLNISDLASLKVLDFSSVDFPKTLLPPPGRYVINRSDVADDKIITFLNALIPLSINVTSIIPRSISIWVMNYTFHINECLRHTNTREFIMKDNKLKHIDLRCINNSISSFEVIDFSSNGLEFISPFISSCFPRIKKIDLSDNQLFKMAKSNFTLFSLIARSFRNLQIVSFSGNRLKDIPYNMFANSSLLEEINLSNNNLQQVTFSLEHLNKLKVLNLGSNLIHILNDASINRLNSIPCTPYHDKNYAIVILTSNAISCATCDAKHFIQWILKTNYVNITSQDLNCMDDDGQETNITTNTVKRLKFLCHLKLYIIIACCSAIFIIILLLALGFKVYKRRLLIRQKEHRYNVIERLRSGHGHYKYASYLIYSLEDTENEDYNTEHGSLVDHNNIVTQDFVENNFLAPLERTLEDEIGVERQLVCCDEDSDGGRSDFNVFFNNLASSSAVVVIASQIFFSNALYCWMLEQVIAQEKYIIFLIEDGVKYNFVKEETKRIFKNSKMFKWKMEDGEFILTSSWREVCTSILDITSLSEDNGE